MNFKLAILFALVIAPAWASRPISERIEVGAYSVALKCDQRWAVQVFEKKGAIVYRCVDEAKGDGLAIELTIYRVALPVDASLSDQTEIADRLVRKDGLKFMRAIFGRTIRLPKRPSIVDCPAGKAIVYADDRRIYQEGQPHFARAALLLPPDYRARLIGYLVVGHQAGGGVVREEQAEYFDVLVRSLQEKQG